MFSWNTNWTFHTNDLLDSSIRRTTRWLSLALIVAFVRQRLYSDCRVSGNTHMLWLYCSGLCRRCQWLSEFTFSDVVFKPRQLPFHTFVATVDFQKVNFTLISKRIAFHAVMLLKPKHAIFRLGQCALQCGLQGAFWLVGCSSQRAGFERDLLWELVRCSERRQQLIPITRLRI